MEPLSAVPGLIEQVHLRLVDAIADGTLAPGARLTQEDLAENLSVSRQPVSHALQLLKRQGLVVEHGRRGFAVAPIDAAVIRDLYQVRAALDGMAARLAAERVGDKEVAVLKKLGGGFGTDEAAHHLDEYSDANIRFHQKILELSGCGLLKGMADGLFLHMRAIRNRAMAEGDRVRRSVADHQHIIAAIEARDPDFAERLVREHTMNLHAHVRRSWPTLGSAARTNTI